MSPEELTNRIQQIEVFISELTQECHILDERRHMLAPLIENGDLKAALKKKLDNTPGVGAWNHLAPLLGQDLVRDQARLFLDNHYQSGSLKNLWRKLLVDPAIKTHFRDTHGRMFDDQHVGAIADPSEKRSAVFMEQLRQQDRDDDYLRFDGAWARLQALIGGLESDPIAKKIKTLRDKYHVHLEMKKLEENPEAFDPNTIGLTFQEVFAFNDSCQAIVAELGLLLTGTNWDPKQFAETHAKQGTAMWETLSA